MASENQQSFEAVYRENAPFVYRYLLRMGCPAQEAEDITQDTFVKALLNIDSYRGECKLSVWLCQIAKNTWLAERKKHRRDAPLLPAEKGIQDPQLWEWVELIHHLEEPYRTVFLKKALGDFSYSELAHQYGKSESWARVTFYRSRMKLRQMLEERRR